MCEKGTCKGGEKIRRCGGGRGGGDEGGVWKTLPIPPSVSLPRCPQTLWKERYCSMRPTASILVSITQKEEEEGSAGEGEKEWRTRCGRGCEKERAESECGRRWKGDEGKRRESGKRND